MLTYADGRMLTYADVCSELHKHLPELAAYFAGVVQQAAAAASSTRQQQQAAVEAAAAAASSVGGGAAVEGGAGGGGGDNEEGASAGRRECTEKRLCESEEEDGGQVREESEGLEAEEGVGQVFQGIKAGDVVHAVWDMREGVLEFALNGFPHPQRMRLSGVSAEAAAGGQQVSALMSVAVCVCMWPLTCVC